MTGVIGWLLENWWVVAVILLVLVGWAACWVRSGDTEREASDMDGYPGGDR